MLRLNMRACGLVLFVGIFFFSLSAPLQASDDGYRLLELDGYKVKWGSQRLGEGASVSYAFAREKLRFDTAINCGELVPIERLLSEKISMDVLSRETAAAFRVWERSAGLSFHEVMDHQNADIVLGAQAMPRGRAYANVSYSNDSEDVVRPIDKALVCLNPEHDWKVGFDGDIDVYDIRYTLIHEIGHAIGLDHPGRSGQVMAFRYTEAFADLQPGDLRGVRLLYGMADDDAARASISGDHPIEVKHSENPLAQAVGSAVEWQRFLGLSNPAANGVGSIAVLLNGIGDFLGIGSSEIERQRAMLKCPGEGERKGAAEDSAKADLRGVVSPGRQVSAP